MRRFQKMKNFQMHLLFKHKGNEKAEEQMHFTDKNFTWHIEESGHFCGWLSYKDLYEPISDVAE